MNNVCGRGICAEYNLGSVVFLILGFTLVGFGYDEREATDQYISKYTILFKFKNDLSEERYDLEDFITTENDTGVTKKLCIDFINEKLDEKGKILSMELSTDVKQLFENYKKIKVRISGSVLSNEVFRTIVEKIKPRELHIMFFGISSSLLVYEDIEDIKLNDNIEVFECINSSIGNMDNLFGSWNINLVNVCISNNNLKSFPVGLCSVPSLKRLDISRNESIFKDWSNSKDKYIKEGKTTLKGLSTLVMRYVELDYMEVDELSVFFNLFQNVESLDIFSSRLKTICVLPKGLKRLNISRNPSIFSDLNGLDNTQIQNICEKFKDINVLYMSNNDLNIIGDEKLSIFFSMFANLEDLDVSYTRLKSIPQIEKLKRLNITGNCKMIEKWNYCKGKGNYQFENVNTLCMKLVNLNFLSEEGSTNFLRSFPNVVDLDISGNSLRKISIPLHKLKTLRVSSNVELEYIKPTEDNPKLFKSLEGLNVHNCKSLVIDDTFLKELKSMKYLNIIAVCLKENGYSEIYKLEKLKIIAIDKNKVGHGKFSKNVKIVNDIDTYRRLVYEDKMQLV